VDYSSVEMLSKSGELYFRTAASGLLIGLNWSVSNYQVRHISALPASGLNFCFDLV
jgi:hypothetical protein